MAGNNKSDRVRNTSSQTARQVVNKPNIYADHLNDFILR